MKPILALVACAVLAACGTLNGNTSVAAGQGLTDVAATLKAAATAADTAALNGNLKGAKAATVSADLKEAQTALNEANTLYQTNHSASIAVQLATVTALAADITTIVSGAQ